MERSSRKQLRGVVGLAAAFFALGAVTSPQLAQSQPVESDLLRRNEEVAARVAKIGREHQFGQSGDTPKFGDAPKSGDTSKSGDAPEDNLNDYMIHDEGSEPLVSMPEWLEGIAASYVKPEQYRIVEDTLLEHFVELHDATREASASTAWSTPYSEETDLYVRPPYYYPEALGSYKESSAQLDRLEKQHREGSISRDEYVSGVFEALEKNEEFTKLLTTAYIDPADE